MAANAYPPPLREVIRLLSRLPGLGEKSATRIAMYLLGAPHSEAEHLARAIYQMKRQIRTCKRCFHLADQELCSICRDPNREAHQLCVVETSVDLLAIESSGAYKGRYHVLQGALSPLDGIGPDDIRIKELIDRLAKEDIREVILATNPSSEGEATAHYLMKVLREFPVEVSRIAYGIPMGGDLKYVDKVTLERALAGRQRLK